MAVESWITPEETPALAAEATALIDTRLAPLGERERLAFWASIEKCYNRPYNHAVPDAVIAEAPEPIEIVLDELPVAVMASTIEADRHAA